MLRAPEEKHKAENLACMHPSCRTIAFNNLAFQMLGREAGLIHETFVKLHGQPKFLLLKLAQDPGLADDVLNICEAGVDAFSKEFLAKHGDSFAEGDALHELLAIAAIGKTNTVRLELLNGYLQRLLRAKANCVVAPDLRVISAEFLLRTMPSNSEAHPKYSHLEWQSHQQVHS